MGIKLPRPGSSAEGDERDAPPLGDAPPGDAPPAGDTPPPHAAPPVDEGAAAPHDDAAEPSEADVPEDPERAVEGPQGPAVPPVIVPRWVQLVLLPLGLLAVWALARASGSVLLILTTASIVALMLNPVVRRFERWRVPRGLAILIVYLGGFAILGGIGVLLSDPVSTQITRFQRDVPHLVSQANKDLTNFQNWLDRNGIKVHIQQQGQTALQTLQKNILKRSGAIVSFSRDILTQVVTVGFDLVLILVLSIYLLVYGRQIGDMIRRIMPDGDGTPEDDFPLLVQHAVFGYVRGQLLFSLIMGASATVALWVFGMLGIFPDGEKYAVFFGAFYGLMEFIPYIGPIIGPAPAVLVALFNNPISAVWVVLMFIGLQQLEGHVVAPQVFRISLRINPIIIILALLIGYQLYGIAGALLALPVAAVVRQTVVYLRAHLVLEPWGVFSPGVGIPPRGGVLVDSGTHPNGDVDGGAGAGAETSRSFDPDHCPDCGTPSGRGDAYCRACGASLEPTVRTPGAH
jgi:predicted PurR-regulated permease PerM